MSDLVVVTYPDEYKAAEVLAALQRLEEKLLIDMEDAAYVVKGKDGKVKMHETVPLTKIGAASGLASGTFWGRSSAYCSCSLHWAHSRAQRSARQPERRAASWPSMVFRTISSSNSRRVCRTEPPRYSCSFAEPRLTKLWSN